TGRIFASTTAGLLLVETKLAQTSRSKKLALAAVLTDGKPLKTDSAHFLKKAFIVPPGVKYLTLRFSDFDFDGKTSPLFSYRLDGFDETWRETDQPEITFTGLPPGKYRFWVKALGKDGSQLEPISVSLRIRPPWHATWWAYSLAVLLASSLIFWVRRNELRRKLEHAENLHLKELDALKTSLYANVTHEFRTPLTLILGEAEQARFDADRLDKQGFLEKLGIIERSGRRLLQLVNQMLDLRKLEAGALQPDWQQGDVVPLLRLIADGFQSLAKSKGIELIFQENLGWLIMDYDADKLQKVVSNLLSNAVKFTPKSGKVSLKLSRENGEKLPSGASQPPLEGWLLIEVSDTGAGISQEDLPRIFDRFFQAKSAAH
ncbi:MAG: ATP-binding protein, partial [Bacteroidota bacterium]